MGMDSLPGQDRNGHAAPAKGALYEGAVKVYGSTWTAFPEDGETELVEGEKVEVVSVEGFFDLCSARDGKAVCPDWRGDYGIIFGRILFLRVHIIGVLLVRGIVDIA